ncbi:TPA: hypothetical protein OOF39_004701 [Kluyvera ascorbata]|nr:hypothetical protein [Kluyvera ascorbata]
MRAMSELGEAASAEIFAAAMVKAMQSLAAHFRDGDDLRDVCCQ